MYDALNLGMIANDTFLFLGHLYETTKLNTSKMTNEVWDKLILSLTKHILIQRRAAPRKIPRLEDIGADTEYLDFPEVPIANWDIFDKTYIFVKTFKHMFKSFMCTVDV